MTSAQIRELPTSELPPAPPHSLKSTQTESATRAAPRAAYTVSVTMRVKRIPSPGRQERARAAISYSGLFTSSLYVSK